MLTTIASRLAVRPDLPTMVLVFFAYSFLGYVLECIVLSIEKRRLVLDRGFTAHLPFCIIYGFGAMAGYALCSPLKDRWPLLFLAGALGATAFEYMVAQLQVRLFGDFWWDYNEKPFNYKGVLCLESTLGWGVAALLVINFLHGGVVHAVSRIPLHVARPLAVFLILLYVLDFIISARQASRRKAEHEQEIRAGQAVFAGRDEQAQTGTISKGD